MDSLQPFQQLAEESFRELFGSDALSSYRFNVTFSGKFTPFNGQIIMRRTPAILGDPLVEIEFRLSKTWRETDTDLVRGLMQSLLAKMFGKNRKMLGGKNGKIVSIRRTTAMDMYEIFIKKIGNYAPITKADPILVASFDRANARYFNGAIERPNLEWGGKTFRKLGHYNYHTDTIMIAKTLESRMDLVDYVMYHEMLHKKHKFYFKNGRSFHHHTAFRTEEAQYENAAALEIELSHFVSKEKRAETNDRRRPAQGVGAPRSILSWFLE